MLYALKLSRKYNMIVWLKTKAAYHESRGEALRHAMYIRTLEKMQYDCDYVILRIQI